MAVIWNPVIRKTVCIDLPNLTRDSNIGFGVCPKTCDPKIVRIDPIDIKLEFGVWMNNWQVEVYTLSSREWRRINPSGNPPAAKRMLLIPNRDYDHPIVVDGCIYWVADETIYIYNDDHDVHSKLIKRLVSFDLTREEFKQLDLPDKLLSCCNYPLQIFQFKESLAREPKEAYKVWILRKKKNGGASFKELLTIDTGTGSDISLSHQPVLRRNGQLMIRKGSIRSLDTRLKSAWKILWRSSFFTCHRQY